LAAKERHDSRVHLIAPLPSLMHCSASYTIIDDCALKVAASSGECGFRTPANLLLQQLVSSAVVDWRTGVLLLRWKHGGESELQYGWPAEE
jgi:hypothetical protein